jgi:hypothetical protein
MKQGWSDEWTAAEIAQTEGQVLTQLIGSPNDILITEETCAPGGLEYDPVTHKLYN